jgi:hypothetical protein
MADFEIDFETAVAAKYELIPAKDDVIRRCRDESPQSLRAIPENHWPLYLGHIKPVGKIKDQRLSAEKLASAVRALVAGLEGKIEPFHVTVLKIVHSIGHAENNIPVDFAVPAGPPWHIFAERLRLKFEGRYISFGKEYKWPDPGAQQVGDLGVFLIPDADNNPVLALRPTSTFGALELVAARLIATGTTFNICENCKTPFLSGGSRGRNKRRGDARFCSDRCRYEFHNRRKAQ